MACGSCGKGPVTQIYGAQNVRTGLTPAAGRNGVYEMWHAQGCFTPYNGLSRNKSVYVVGLMEGEGEKIFQRADAKEAVAYAQSNGLSLHHLPAQNLCTDVMEAFFGD